MNGKRPIGDRLLDTAIDQFGRKGIEGASTRAIAAAAKTAMSSITYHYGGKQGLHLAAARHIAHQINGRMSAAAAVSGDPAQLESGAAVEGVLAMADAFLRLMLSPDSAPWARFIVREQLEPTKAFTILWDEMMSGLSRRLVTLVERAGGGRWNPEETRIRALTVLGQILVFRVARATVLRITDWHEVTAANALAIRSVVHANLRAILEAPEVK
jgi:TetR/AcrR family transcriptional regulator, regulator of cefoperazone and chloramphenicol sensitivity